MQRSIHWVILLPGCLSGAGLRCGLDEEGPCSHGMYSLAGKIGIIQIIANQRSFRKVL